MVVVSDLGRAFHLTRFYNHPPKRGALRTGGVACGSARQWRGIIGLEILAGIVRGRVDPADGDRFDNHQFTSSNRETTIPYARAYFSRNPFSFDEMPTQQEILSGRCRRRVGELIYISAPNRWNTPSSGVMSRRGDILLRLYRCHARLSSQDVCFLVVLVRRHWAKGMESAMNYLW